jgi:hypothetical protein
LRLVAFDLPGLCRASEGLGRQGRGCFVSLGSAPFLQAYAVRSLMPAAAAAAAVVFPSAIFYLRSLTCASVTIRAP